jgi:hypothetical protein
MSSVGYSHDKGKYKGSKTYTKDFIVDADNTVDIDNKYGKVTITTWGEKGVHITVTVTVKSDDKELIEEKLDGINVSFSQTETHVYAVTHIKSMKDWSFISFSNKASVNYSIDYEIKMPASNNLDINNDYGSIFIDNLDGSCKINCDYGSLRAGKLNNKSNKIYMDYGKNSSIDFVNSAKINTDYSYLSIERANELQINADYSHLDLNQIGFIHYNNDYGSLIIEKAKTVEGNGDYLTLKVYELDENLNVSGDFGSIKLYQINEGFKKINIDSDYTGVKLGVKSGASFSFDFQSSYADISIESLEEEYNIREKKMFSKHYKGFVNNENNNSKIIVNVSYASIKLYKSKK